MAERIIGTCSLCGGPVVTGGTAPDHCTQCKAVVDGQHGPVIQTRNPQHVPGEILTIIPDPGKTQVSKPQLMRTQPSIKG